MKESKQSILNYVNDSIDKLGNTNSNADMFELNVLSDIRDILETNDGEDVAGYLKWLEGVYIKELKQDKQDLEQEVKELEDKAKWLSKMVDLQHLNVDTLLDLSSLM